MRRSLGLKHLKRSVNEDLETQPIAATKIFQKRRRRDYRLARKAQFVRPEPGFSLYEGRTRGKRPRYTYSDEEDGGSDALSIRRSHRHSGISTPAESSGPTFTASGRQVRSRHGGTYGETMLSGQQDTTEQSRIGGLDEVEDDEDEGEPRSRGRPRRAARQNRIKPKPFSRKQTEGYDSLGSMEDESDVTSSGNEWDGGDEDEPDDQVDDEEEDEDVNMSDNSKVGDEEDDSRQSLVVSLRYAKSRQSPPNQDTRNGPTVSTNLKGPSEAPYSPDGLTKSLNDTSKPIRDERPTHYSRSLQQPQPSYHGALTGHAASAQPQVSQSTPVAPPEKDSMHNHSDYFQPVEHPAPRVSWPSSEKGVVASKGTPM